MASIITIGLISDTHGLLRPEAVEALRGSDFIIHAGDIGGPAILSTLARIAPVTAIRGNVDKAPWASSIPETEVLEVGGLLIYVIHGVGDLDLDPAAAGFDVVVHGHSHQPGAREKDDVLYVNPGSAGPRRFELPISVGRLVVRDGAVSDELIEIEISKREDRRAHIPGPFARGRTEIGTFRRRQRDLLSRTCATPSPDNRRFSSAYILPGCARSKSVHSRGSSTAGPTGTASPVTTSLTAGPDEAAHDDLDLRVGTIGFASLQRDLPGLLALPVLGLRHLRVADHIP